MANMTPTKICEALVGCNDQVRLGVEEGSIHTTMQHIGCRLVQQAAWNNFLRSWNQQEEQMAPNFVARQQAALREFDRSAPVSQPVVIPAPVAVPAQVAAPTKTKAKAVSTATSIVTPASHPQQSQPATAAPATCVSTDARTAPAAADVPAVRGVVVLKYARRENCEDSEVHE
ncbi:hypothetical protein BYT27DRAFT_7210159 [Phlegmacium glaucopus]|nr:hypothetical protein BYT27DRAFT_7210159 [Phlegmacium glaucopus]